MTPPTNKPLVVNLGLPKSGTTTLARALREAGMKVADYRIRRHDTDDPTTQGRFVSILMYDDYFASGDPLARLGEFDALTEINVMRRGHSLWPQTDFGILTAIEQHHPNVRFLASARDPRDQALSMLKWSDMGSERLPAYTIPGLPRSYGETTHERARWIASHHAFLRRIFGNRDNFLEYDVADPEAPKKIGAFLGRDLPWWGKLNTAGDWPKRQGKTNKPDQPASDKRSKVA